MPLDVNKLEYGSLILNFNLPKWPWFVRKIVDSKDLAAYGYSEEPHVTILYGFHAEVKLEDVKVLLLPLADIRVVFTDLNFFKTAVFDIAKLDASSLQLTQLNELVKTLPHETLHSQYNPHMTLAYLKSGVGEKYKKPFKPFTLQPISYTFNQPGQGSTTFVL